MKKSIITFCFLFLQLIALSQHIQKVKINDIVKMIDTSNATLVINFWASWCKPCVHEIPWLEKNILPLQSQDVKLILVSVDSKSDYLKNLQAFANKEKYQSTIIWLDESNADFFCPKIDKSWDGSIPVTLMVNNKKKYKQFFGYQLTEPRLQLELKKLLE